jgi:hypothetical protein
VSVIADARDGRRKVVNLDREMRRVHRRVRRLEEVYLPVIKLKPRAGIVRAIGSIDNRQTEYVSIERMWLDVTAPINEGGLASGPT